MDHSKTLIINTGGTFGMVKSDIGYVNKAGFLAEYIKTSKELNSASLPNFDIVEFHPLLDSANMTYKDWQKIADLVFTHYENYSGFVIIHGTDTMAYTASALSFMLENLGKPVIITGSQVPLMETHSDAHDNLVRSLIFSANENIFEVCIYFNNCLLRGNRAVKSNAKSFQAFSSPNFDELGNIGTSINLKHHLLLKKPEQPFSVMTLSMTEITIVQLFPSMCTDIMEHTLAKPTKALILQTYGLGNAPSENKSLLEILKKANDQGILIINQSQCFQSAIETEHYETGQCLSKIGTLPSFDMTSEAIITKLFYLFSKHKKDIAKIKSQFVTDIAGELSKNLDKT